MPKKNKCEIFPNLELLDKLIDTKYITKSIGSAGLSDLINKNIDQEVQKLRIEGIFLTLLDR